MDNYELQNGIYRPRDVGIKDFLPAVKGELELILRDGKTGRIKNVSHFNNMFVTQGKYSLAQALSGNITSGQGQITYMELGTSGIAPALGDTGLKAAVFRKLISVRSYSANIATFQCFFSTSDVTGTLLEAGLYGDSATTQLLSGTLYARAAINRIKSANDTLTVTWTVSFL